MLIDRKYRIFEAVSKDLDRPVLNCVFIFRIRVASKTEELWREVNKWLNQGFGKPEWLDKWPREHLEIRAEHICNGVAVATNGFILAVAPVKLDTWDNGGDVDTVPYLIPANILDKAFKLKKNEVLNSWEWPDVSLKLEPNRVTLADESIHQINTDGYRIPDFMTIALHHLKDSNGTVPEQFVFDPNGFVSLVKALGLPLTGKPPGSSVAIAFDNGNRGATFVQPLSVAQRELVAPFGILMGQHIR